VQDAPEPWWTHALSYPAGEDAAALLRVAVATPASTLDPDLPAIPLDAWLFLTIAPRIAAMRSQLVDWTLTACDDVRRAVPAPGPESCAEGEIALSPDRAVHILIAIADLVMNRQTGQAGWRTKAPVLRDVYIKRIAEQGSGDSLDVPKLGELPSFLDVPFAQWPAADFQTDITWTPQHPVPGDTVRVHFLVRNSGRRYVSRADVQMTVAGCCGGKAVRRDWYPHLAPGESATFDLSVRLREGTASALLVVKPLSAFKPVRDANPNRVPTLRVIGVPEG
jgi:hypothetical protein